MSASQSRAVEAEITERGHIRVSFEGELVRPAEELDVGWEGRRGNKDDT